MGRPQDWLHHYRCWLTIQCHIRMTTTLCLTLNSTSASNFWLRMVGNIFSDQKISLNCYLSTIKWGSKAKIQQITRRKIFDGYSTTPKQIETLTLDENEDLQPTTAEETILIQVRGLKEIVLIGASLHNIVRSQLVSFKEARIQWQQKLSLKLWMLSIKLFSDDL